MHRRSLRYGLVVLLFATTAGAAAFAWTADRELADLTAREHAAAARFDGLVLSIARFDAAQQTFDPARESEADWFVRVRRLLVRIQSETAGLHGSPESAAAARTFDDITARVASAVQRAEENYQAGHDLMAADLVQDEGRPGAEAMRAAILEWRAAEAGAVETARTALLRQLWSVLGGAAAFWALGVLLLAPRGASSTVAAAEAAPVESQPAGDAPLSLSLQAPTPPAPAAPPPTTIDLGPAAALCADIARADTAAAFDALLERAAGVLGASGLVVWLKAPGDELIPAVVHGYGPEAQAYIGNLPLADSTLTTRAWHSGALQSSAGDTRSHAALAAPMYQGAQPTGVFAVELTSHAEATPDIRALTAILAAQFAGAMAPAALAPDAAPVEPVAADQPLEATGS